ncbi:MAG: sulfurtransferase-like selenium metabolism protein YedF [Clostridium sulfidigenes]|uniref:Sulfurtransferase-like selenium metabolism protein YedF n=1 Tax=Clostridium sulfidigenes TaxID=318464 RepID=A0A927W7Q1_9CLOT|nr:sulfurtransferase-like selenium metabolism protein YedF [Clostridium sulfidigenes]
MRNEIDCRGLNCPIPVVNTKKYFDALESGIGVTVVDNEVAKNNVVKFAQGNGFNYEIEEREGNIYNITITKGEVKVEELNLKNSNEKEEIFTIVIGSDKLGNGDDELGTALIKSYLFALSEAEVIPTNLVFLNAGVKLVVEGALTLDSLKRLVERGVNVQSCGLCLDFYGLKENLAVGEISNMYAIIEMMNKGKTIKL